MGVAAAAAAAVIAAGAGLEPEAVAVPTAAAAAVALVFALRPAAGVGAFLVLILFSYAPRPWLTVDVNYFDEISVAFFVIASAAMNRARIVRLRPGGKEGALAVVVGAGILSSLLGAVSADTWIPALLLLTKGIAFFYAVSWLRLEIAEVEGVGAMLLVAASVVLFLGFFEALNPGGYERIVGIKPYGEVRGGLRVVTSVFEHPSLFGWFTAYVSLLLYARFMVFRQWWTLAAAVLLNIGTLISGRRRPVAGVMAALGVGVAWSWRQRTSRRAMLRVFAPLAAGALVLTVLTGPALSSFYAQTVREYLSGGDLGEILGPDPDAELIAGAHPRAALYVASVAIARDYFPVGAGLGRFGSYMSQAHYSPLYERYGLTDVHGLGPQDPVAITDTFWPMILAELGPLGLVGMSVFLALLFRILWRIAGSTQSPGRRAVTLAAMFVLVEGLVGSLTSATLAAPPVGYYIFAAAAAAIAIGRGPSDSAMPLTAYPAKP